MASDPHDYIAASLGQDKKPHACVVTIFGASGDLTKRKLIPALYNLALEKRLPERIAVVVTERRVGGGVQAAGHDQLRRAVLALGGFDSPIGAVVGGLIIGIADALTRQYIPALAGIEVVVPFGLILVVLLVRPQGLFGHVKVERV